MRDLLLRRRALLMAQAAQGGGDDKFQFVIDTRLGTSSTFVMPFTNGTYTTINEFIIDWGDGETTTINNTFNNTNKTHTYADNGEYTITFSNVDKICPPFAFSASTSAPMLVEFNMRNKYKFVATNGSFTYAYPNNYLNGCKNLVSEIYIEDDITSIGAGAFYNCNNIIGEIIIPNGVTVIGQNTFRACSKLTKTTIHAGVTSIGVIAFGYNPMMNVYSYIQTPFATGSNAFYQVQNELHVPAGTAAAYAALVDWNKFTNIIDDL